jgi:hypothetical protein
LTPKLLIPAKGIVCYAILLTCSFAAHAQTDSTQQKLVQSFNTITTKSLHVLDNKYSLLNKLVERKTERMLRHMQKKEQALQQQMQGKDSLKAKAIFAGTEDRYKQLFAQLNAPTQNNFSSSFKQYIPGLDSMQTAMQFLNQGKLIPGIAQNKLQQVQAISGQLQQLQGKFQQAGQIQDYIRQREQQLKDQLLQYGLGKQLLGMNKEVYYYQQQLAGYKDILNDKEKMQQLVLNAVRQIPAFQNFWQKYSMLAQLFPMPANYGTTQALTGLQTRNEIQNLLTRAGGSISDNPQYMSQQIQQSQSSLSQLKDKVSGLGGTNGGGDMTMPDFKPNQQHTKSFLKRLEYGFDIQNAQSTHFLPTTSNIALTAGYKFSNKIISGIGASYIMGWGTALNHIRFSNQGIGLRSFADFKAKGSIWITGGFEYTYYQEFASLSEVRHIDAWQKSALMGLTKKYSIGTRTANMQLLYDFLYSRQVPKGQPVKFRMGYSL